MEAKVSNKELSPLSATKAKTLDNCTWLYWCNYHLKLPQDKNEGAMKGDICHSIFELLLAKNRKHYVQKMVKLESVTAIRSIERLIKLYIVKNGLPNTSDVLQQIDKMIVVGLKSDFYVKDGVLVAPEFKFDIKKPKFRIKGFMDKPFIVGDKVIIDDFKSSKKKFEGLEETANMQAMFYSYAAKQLWPHLTPIVRFVFLQYPENPMMEVKFSDDSLKGFEEYLIYIQKRVEQFNEVSARGFFAADIEPHDNGFNGRLLCGFAKQPNQLKKDGTKMWHCPYRFAFDYWAVKKEGKVIYAVKDKSQLKPLKTGETVEFLRYEGCPKHSSALDSFSKTRSPKKSVNVLDDF